MSTVSVREFSYNPSAMFARVEQGETIEVTRHGSVIAVLLPGSGIMGRYATLVAKGAIRLKATTTSDIDRIPRYDVPPGVSPLDLLLADREEDER
ncbi:type II toxin-antitoxin system Phd/YefM family antitoxin [Micromonospora sp. WMMD975]|uniref:type II toxin-antitoxin system Phd/YefM family antitoxin n=1 Tax=Micromonospora sp. WMMD975 TaxID=3016087 RepID=UPI00249B447C|nr:type II toxin-antitoxin system Phd/YefM family antitoxin [Micromonospora sp. WMMD975]WFE32802.1 type II toxin-antitoxin system Phd/YefM family antitoxin [Micromonospora sp. WMMD975]